MYNLNQSYGMGYLNYMDWKSVELAGVGSKQLKQTIIDTAVEMGKIKKDQITIGNFAHSLKDKWADTEVMEAAFGKFSTAMDEAYKLVQSGEFELASDALKSLEGNWDELSLTASQAAQNAKTFNEAILATKDAVSSKWMKTFEIIFGDYEEAKQLWTELANELYEIFAESGNARNKMLQGWKDLGGRDDLIQSFKNIYHALRSIIDPIHDAFRDIFPPMTSERLANLTKGLREFTERLKVSDETAEKIRSTFKGLFSFLKIVGTVLKTLIDAAFKLLGVFKGLVTGTLGLTGSFGEWITKIKDTIVSSNTLADVLNHIVTAIGNVVGQIGNFAKETLKFDKIVNFFKGIFTFIAGIAKSLGKMLQEALREGDIKAAIDVLNGGLFAALLQNFNKFTTNLTKFSDNLKGTLGALKGILVEYQKEIKAKTLMTIAKAIAILAASLFVLSLINPERLAGAIGAMAVVITELMGALWAFTKVTKGLKGSLKGSLVMISLTLSILGMADALKKIASIEPDRLLQSLGAMIAGIGALVLAIHALPEKDTRKAASAIGKLSFALLIYGFAMKVLGSVPWPNLIYGTLAAAAALTMMVVALRNMPDKGNFMKGASMIEMALSLVILAGALKILATMSWDDIGRSLSAMGGALLELTLALKFIPKGSIFSAAGLLVSVFSMILLGGALKILATMSWDDIGRSMVAMGGALLALTLATKFMSIKGSAAMLITANSLIVLAAAMKILGSMDLASIGIALLAIAGAFTVLGVAGLLLSKIAIPLAIAAGAMALFGLGAVLFGKGLVLIAAGIAALAGALSAGVTAIVGGITGIILGIAETIPEIISIMGKAILTFCDVIMQCAPTIAKTILTVIYEVLNSLADFAPMIVKELARFITGLFRSLADYVPDMLVAFMELLASIFKGAIKALSQIDPDVLLKSVVSLGVLVVVMHLLASLVALTPMALLGVLAFGALVTELAGVIALVGNLAKIDGFQELLTNGGNILQLLGTAIGQFIGGIVGGFGLGVSSVLPDIANNLSEFMKNIKPFIEGARDIDPSILGKLTILSGAILVLSTANLISGIMQLLTFGRSLGDLGTQLSEFMNNSKDFIYGAGTISPGIVQNVATLAEAILILTSANLLNNISNFFSFLTGGNSLSDFGDEISSLGTNIKEFSENLGTFSGSQVKSIECATDAIKALAMAAKDIPNEGGLWSWIAGDNSIGKFSEYLPDLGTNLTKFVSNLGTFSDTQVTSVNAAGNAIKALAEASKDIPNEGGLWSWIAGDNSIGKFSEYLPDLASNLNDFVTNLNTFTEEQVKTVDCAANAIKLLCQAASEIPNSGGMVSWFTGDNDLGTFGGKLPGVATNISQFVNNLGTFGDAEIKTTECAANALKALCQAASEIPNSGGLVTLFAGDNDISKFAFKLPMVGTYLSQFVSNLGTFGDAQIQTADCAGRALTSFVTATGNIPNSGGLVSLFTGDNDISMFAWKLPGVAKHLNEFISNLGTFGEDKIATTDCAARAIASLATAASGIPDSGGLKMLFVGDNDISIFAWKLPGVATHLKEFANNLGTFSDEQVKSIECAANAIKEMANAASGIPNSGGLKALFTGDNDISKFADKFPGVGWKLKEFADALGTFDDAKLQTVKTAVEALKEVASLGWLSIQDKAGQKLEEYAACMVSMAWKFHEFVNAASQIDQSKLTTSIDVLKQLGTINEVITDGSIENLEKFGESLKNIATDGINSFVNAFTDEKPRNDATNGIRDLITRIIDGAESRRTDITDKAESLANAALNVLTSVQFAANVESAGKSFAQGFANGIMNNRYLAINAGTTLGNDAYEAARKSIDAHSPSKKAHKLGNFFGIGLVNGIKEYAEKVYDVSYNIAEQAKNGLSKAISKVSDIISNGIDENNLTIRPVLDLSEVQSGTAAINGMFNGLQSVGISSNLNAISTGMRNNQNGEDEVVSAIDRLNKNMGNSKGDTYNINGITYDDGTEVSEAVKTLVRAAKIERRT